MSDKHWWACPLCERHFRRRDDCSAFAGIVNMYRHLMDDHEATLDEAWSRCMDLIYPEEAKPRAHAGASQGQDSSSP